MGDVSRGGDGHAEGIGRHRWIVCVRNGCSDLWIWRIIFYVTTCEIGVSDIGLARRRSERWGRIDERDRRTFGMDVVVEGRKETYSSKSIWERVSISMA